MSHVLYSFVLAMLATGIFFVLINTDALRSQLLIIEKKIDVIEEKIDDLMEVK